MSDTVLGRLMITARAVTPAMATLALILLTAVPAGIPDGLAIQPVVALLPVYYWSVYRPDLMPIGAAFLIGLFVDLLFASPPGLTAGLLVLVQWTTAGQRRVLAGRGFWAVWLGYAVISAGAMIAYWLVFCVFAQQYAEPSPLAFGYLLGLVTYPAFSHVFGRLHQRLLQI